MSQLPETQRGHEEPYAVQFSIFLANRVGQLGEMLDVFEEANVEVFGMSIVDSTDWAVIRVIFSDPNKARELMKSHSLPFTESDVLLVEIPDRQSLRELLATLLRAEINIHFSYNLLIRSNANPVMVFHVEDAVLATQILTRHGYVLLGHEDLADPA